MYDRILDLLTEAVRNLSGRNRRASAVIRRNPGTAISPSGKKPHTSPYEVATAQMRVAGEPAPQPPESQPPGADTLPRPVRKRTAKEDAASAAAKLASSAAAAKRKKRKKK